MVRSQISKLYFRTLLTTEGWLDNVRITVRSGRIHMIESNATVEPEDEIHEFGLPGMPNLHSHAFQRGMAGMAEVQGPTGDSFWTWRDVMYRFVDRLNPEDLKAIAALAYVEMLESGFTRVGEFHYLHHDNNGERYSDPTTMSRAIIEAAAETGIALTHLPVFYAHSGFGGAAPGRGQRRFIHSLDEFATLVESLRTALSVLPDAVLGVAPHSLRAVTPAELGVLMEMSSEGPIHIHIAEQMREVEDCIAWSGLRPVEWLLRHAAVDERWCLIHATHMTAYETRALAESGAVAGLCPITEANLGDGVFPIDLYLKASGRYGIGSDSNVLVSMAEELRTLEYGQRLAFQGRNRLAQAPGGSTGATILQAAHSGGCMALGVDPEIAVGGPADLISLATNHPSLFGKKKSQMVDAFVFATARPAIDCVWRGGIKVVERGEHHLRASITERYRSTLKRVLG